MSKNNLFVQSIPCHGYPFSNDSWSREEAGLLQNLLSCQQIDRKRATGLVIGSGGLPYILGYLGTSQATILDRDPNVIESVCSRVELVEDVESWGEYTEAVEAGLNERMRKSFRREYTNATRSGLRGSLALTAAGAATTEIRGQQGDVLDVLPDLAEQYRDEDRIVSYVNVTNVGPCLWVDTDPSPYGGRKALAGLLSELPLAEDAVIVESGPGALRAHVRTADDYFQNVYSTT